MESLRIDSARLQSQIDALASISEAPSPVVTRVLFSDADLKKQNIDVAVKDGEVTLSGTVRKGEYQQRAMQLAQSATGVKKVYDQMNLPGQPPPPPPLGAAGTPASQAAPRW